MACGTNSYLSLSGRIGTSLHDLAPLILALHPSIDPYFDAHLQLGYTQRASHFSRQYNMETLGTATRSCLHTFATLCHKFERDGSPDTSCLVDLQEEFGKFKIWTANLGVLAKGHGSLDWRLRDADVTRSTILSLLQQLNQTLQLGAWLHIPDHPEKMGLTNSFSDRACVDWTGHNFCRASK